MFKKFTLAVLALSIILAGCAPGVAETVVSQPQSITLIGQSAVYALYDMDIALYILTNVQKFGPYTLAYTNSAGEFMWATLYRVPEISGDAAAFMFSGDKDYSKYYEGANNLLEVCENLVNDGWVRVTRTDPTMPVAIAQFLRFINGVSTGLVNVSMFAVPVIINEDGGIMLPEQLQAPRIDT